MRHRPTTDFFAAALVAGIGFGLGACNTTEQEEAETGAASIAEREFRTDGMQEHLSSARAAKGRLFMAQNKLRPEVVSRPSGLQYIVLEEGDGDTPTLDDKVVTHYRVSSVDGRQIDDSSDYGGPQEFRVDKVIAGWREALQEMKVGARWKLFVPAELAYGERGLAQIPGGETLVYDLELLGVIRGEPDLAAAGAEEVPAPPADLDLGDPGRAEEGEATAGAGEFSDLGQGEPGSAPRRGDLSLDNLDLLD